MLHGGLQPLIYRHTNLSVFFNFYLAWLQHIVVWSWGISLIHLRYGKFMYRCTNQPTRLATLLFCQPQVPPVHQFSTLSWAKSHKINSNYTNCGYSE